MACGMCAGTDCADACDQGWCYAEEQQRRFEEEEQERQMMDDASEAAVSICAFAQHFATTHQGDKR